jgi:hypothetical protein
MGQSGEDIILSPAYRKLLNLDIECKNVENLVVPTIFTEHFNKYKHKPSLKILTHKRNRTEALVTLRWVDFLNILRRLVNVGQPEVSVPVSHQEVLRVQTCGPTSTTTGVRNSGGVSGPLIWKGSGIAGRLHRGRRTLS